MTTQHTPSPWKAYHYVTDENGRHTSTVAADDGNFRICELTQRFPVPVADTVKANARLIAASPDLLTACESALALLSNPDAEPGDADAVTEMLKTALAKARGGA